MSEIIKIPDIGDVGTVAVIEILVAVGDEIKVEDAVITLESDKATLEVPTPVAGIVKKILLQEGDEVSAGSEMLEVEVANNSTKKETSKDTRKNTPKETKKAEEPKVLVEKPMPKKIHKKPPPVINSQTLSGKKAHASPAIRKFARELGADINNIPGSGRKGRISKEDVKAFIKQVLTSGNISNVTSNFEVMPPANVDFSQFGQTQTKALSRIQKLSGKYLHRNWVRIPHVTQFDEANITDMEAFRQENKASAKAQGFSLTPLAFIVKAVAVALRKFPTFNSSLDASGENLILKKYYNIGIAVDTPNGLVVPVIRAVNNKTVMEIAAEMGKISAKARSGKLSPSDMQGGCISVSSLGGIGGTAFTPIINAPEVAILGVSRSKIVPRYNRKGEIVPSLMLPLSLSYDHRVIDGAEAARFTVYLASVLSDLKKMLL
ncbi:MAG: dihydrolipoyllysine-residue acetyltransferase [Proteobacteria bacterium]|nr:dihydrolipoyllysine-residue acetyltransferase [Pseudomonadota bacterium]